MISDKAHANTMEPSVLFIRCLCCCFLAALILICYEQWIVVSDNANILAAPFFFAILEHSCLSGYVCALEQA
jgi:hypothetical protein